MIGIGFQVQIKKSKVLTEPARTLAMPLVAMMQVLANRILPRIASGQGPRGPWDTYSGRAPRAGAMFWVAPGKPQPGGTPGQDGFGFRVTSGEWKGWAAYTSVNAYYKLRGIYGQPHDFSETNELLSRTAIRIVSARHTRLAFYGGHKSGLSAKQLGWLVSKDESDPLFMPSKAEVEEAQAFAARHINEAIVEAGRVSEGAQQIASRGRTLSSGAKNSINRRVSRLLGD